MYKNFLNGGLRKKNLFKSNTQENPLISIITVVLNNEKYFQECLDSLHSQNYQNYEHIVVDGGSTDDTIKIIKKNEDKIDYWISEQDKGIYDGFNKGMSLARGEYIGFLNSDDKFYNNKTLNYVVDEFKKNLKLTFFMDQ